MVHATRMTWLQHNSHRGQRHCTSRDPSCTPVPPCLSQCSTSGQPHLPASKTQVCLLQLQGIGADLSHLAHMMRPSSAVYSALTLAFSGAAAYLAAPVETLKHVLCLPSCPLATLSDWVFLWRSTGAALLVLPAWTYSLKVPL